MAIVTYLLCGFFSNSCERAASLRSVTILIVSLGRKMSSQYAHWSCDGVSGQCIDDLFADGPRGGAAFDGFLDSQGQRGITDYWLRTGSDGDIVERFWPRACGSQILEPSRRRWDEVIELVERHYVNALSPMTAAIGCSKAETCAQLSPVRSNALIMPLIALTARKRGGRKDVLDGHVYLPDSLDCAVLRVSHFKFVDLFAADPNCQWHSQIVGQLESRTAPL